MPRTELPSIAELNMRAQRVAVIVDADISLHCYALAGLARSTLGGLRSLPVPAHQGQVLNQWVPLLIRYDPDLIIDLTDFPVESRVRLEQYVFPFVWLTGSVTKKGSSAIGIEVSDADTPFLPPFCRSHPDSELRWPLAIEGLDDLELMILAFYGVTKVPEVSRSSASRPANREGLVSDLEKPYDHEDPWGEGTPTPLQATDCLLTPEREGGAPAKTVIVVSETPNPLDFWLYWSLRAVCPDSQSTLWLPLSDLAGCERGPLWDRLNIQRWFGRLRPGNGPSVLASASVSPQVLADVARTVETRVVQSGKRPWPLPKDRRPPPVAPGDLVRAHAGGLESLWPATIRWEGNVQLRPVLARQYEALCDLAFPRDDIEPWSTGTVVVDFRADRLALAEGKDAAKLYSDDPARVGPHDLSIAIRPSAQTLRVRFPDAKALVQVYFQSRGFALRLGRKHMLAQRVIDSLGGSDPAGLLGSTPACLVLHKLVGGSWTHGDLLRLIGEEGADDPVRLLAALVNSGVLLRGFFTACEDCGSDLFLGLGDLAENPKCSICGGRCSVPVNAPWGYRLSSLFAEAVREGVLLHAVTLLALEKHHLRGFAGLPGGVIEGRDREIDVLGFWQGKLVVCECKKAIGKDPLTVAELDGLVNLARDLNASKVFAVTLGTFSREVTRRAQASTIPPVALLEGPTLFSSS